MSISVPNATRSRPNAAKRGQEQIAVEIQSFLGASPIRDLQEAVGQYGVYRAVLSVAEPRRALYLAVSSSVYAGWLSEPFSKLVLKSMSVRVLVFDEEQEEVTQWIEPNDIEMS